MEDLSILRSGAAGAPSRKMRPLHIRMVTLMDDRVDMNSVSLSPPPIAKYWSPMSKVEVPM